MFHKKLMQMGTVVLATTMMVGIAGCSRGGKKETPQETTTEFKEEFDINEVQDGVNVPDNFDNMLYPMKALAMEYYRQGYPYYVQFEDGSSRDSFWYSCALTAKYMNEAETDTVELDAEDFEQIVSGLYASFQEGNLEFPEIREGITYVRYSDDGAGYVFASNDSEYVPSPDKLNDYTFTVTSCQAIGSNYLVNAELENSNTGDSLGTYEYELTATKYTGDGNPFAYSVVSMKDAYAASTEESTSTEENASTETTAENGSTETTQQSTSTQEGKTTTEEERESTTEEEEATSEEEENQAQASIVDESQALALAKSAYGNDANYSYQGIHYIDSNPYHMFSVESDSLTISYVLVSQSGQDVMGANKNSDGSWSFDQ